MINAETKQGAMTSKMTQADKLAADIADAIVTGDLGPGSRLDEQTLATRFAVSRTPVREALRQVAATGLVELRPRRGAVVAAVTPEQLDVMFVAMGELEATCARLSAMCMTPVERRRMQAQHDAMGALVRAAETEGFAEANAAFHSMIYAGAHNAILADAAAGLRRRLQPFRRAQFRSAGRLPQSYAEHGAIVVAILAGDVAAAHGAMLHHVSLVEDAFARLTSSHAA